MRTRGWRKSFPGEDVAEQPCTESNSGCKEGPTVGKKPLLEIKNGEINAYNDAQDARNRVDQVGNTLDESHW
jgi:hypothetical protein